MPFTVALALLFGLMLLEMIAALPGGSLKGIDADTDLNIAAEPDFGLGADVCCPRPAMGIFSG